ncbi:MAG: SpoIIE family protein phosphatase [Clostridia bacterium]|nr:SpoIIE family protein phosphatase [Clostridia bacterium]
MHVKLNFKTVSMYAIYALALIALNYALPKVPFGLGLCFSMLVCGTNIIAAPVLYALSSIVTLDWITMLLSLFECGFLTAITFIYRRTRRKIRFESIIYILLSLAPFIAFSRWQGIDNLYITSNPYVLKSIAALAVTVFTFFAFRCVHSLLFRLYRCKLRADELICISVVCIVAGVGICNLAGIYAYICIGAGVTAFAVRLTKSPAAVIVACVLSAPCAIVGLNFQHVTAFVIIAIIALAFAELGRFAPVVAALAGGAGYLYLTGAFTQGVASAVIYALILVLCCILPVLPPQKSVENMRNLLAVKKVLPRTDEERYKEYVSEKLYRMSEVFREIESAFVALDDGPDDGAMKKRMLAETKQSMCAGCKKKDACSHTKVYRGFSSLIEAGCLKGKVSFVDLSSDITLNCSDPANLIETVNHLLYEYRKMTLEAENAKSGRKLLAGQARGIAEVLKGRAVEFCRESDDFSAMEKKIGDTLAANGVSCPEIRMRGQANKEISLTVVDCKNFNPVKKTVESVTGLKLMLKDKTVYDGQKTAYLLVEPPKYDAAFGVAFAVKDNERVSGDTHSVIKINEHSFLMALSDGMGSGEYARKVSTTAISLIEAFYRSEIPTDIVLDTINKLLCFNRDERFTCIDAAAIDLNTLTASFIKIGSPVGIIVRKGEIKVLESHSLPLGILDSLHPTTCKEQLKNNDIVTFMSDGVTSAFNGVSDLYDFLQTLKPLNPQNLAEKILAAAKERVQGTPDDMTVLCVRIFKRQV